MLKFSKFPIYRSSVILPTLQRNIGSELDTNYTRHIYQSVAFIISDSCTRRLLLIRAFIHGMSILYCTYPIQSVTAHVKASVTDKFF